MADDRERPNTHITDLVSRIRARVDNPTNPVVGDMYFNLTTNYLCYYTGNTWIGVLFA